MFKEFQEWIINSVKGNYVEHGLSVLTYVHELPDSAQGPAQRSYCLLSAAKSFSYYKPVTILVTIGMAIVIATK